MGFGDGVPSQPVSEWFKLDKFDSVHSKLKPMTRRAYIAAILALMKCTNDTDNQIYKDLSEKRDVHNKQYERLVLSGERTETEKALWVDPELLGDTYGDKVQPFLDRMGFLDAGGSYLSSRSLYDDSEIQKILDYIVMATYLYPFYYPDSRFGVLRNDLDNLIIRKGSKVPDEDIKENFLQIISSKKMIFRFRNHKNDFYQGEIQVEVPRELRTIYRNWIRFMDLGKGDILFEKLKKAKITTILQKYTRNWLGSPLGTQMLRKIFVTYKFPNREEYQDMKETSHNMMHSIRTQQTIYSKNIKKEKKENNI
jgi:hypothetical protein